MFKSTHCSFCNQPFDYEEEEASASVECPACGKANRLSVPGESAQKMTLLHDAPTLAGAKECPSCKTTVERDAVLCIHCGYHFATGKKIGEESWFAKNKKMAILMGIGLVFLLTAVGYALWPAANPSPPVVFAPPPVPLPPPEPQPALHAPLEENTPEPTATGEEPEPATPEEPAEPPPPPGPTPEELAVQQAAEQKAAFEAKKIEAEKVLRQRLDAREPLYKLGESIEIRRRNGIVNKGVLKRYAGSGAERMAILETDDGHVDVPLSSLDPSSRRRMDPEYREAFIRHMLSTRMSEPAGSE
ncbi:MAG: hypothetical protein LBN38_04700 [Verrucomicrobiota bacterium]|jgi:ribosomal protein L32|nr:hypothetical protein [Verrucomicrobiota bacterium]